MQYGSYFQATSHDRVFSSVSGKFLARFVDYFITFTQFCISFVMLAGAGANLNTGLLGVCRTPSRAWCLEALCTPGHGNCVAGAARARFLSVSARAD